jgi:hypothetical protein
MKRVIHKKEVEVQRDEHELLQQEDFTWLANFRDVLSPYWSVRLQYRTTSRAPLVELLGHLPKEVTYHKAA